MNIQPDKVERAKAIVVVARGLSNKLPPPFNVRYPTTKSDADSEPDKKAEERLKQGFVQYLGLCSIPSPFCSLRLLD